MKEGRKAYNYRSTKRVLKAVFWVLFGPLFLASYIEGTLHPSHLQTLLDPVWMRWLFVSIFFFVVLGELGKAFEVFFERIVIEGSHLTYYNWFGWRKISVELTEIEEIDIVRGPAWEVFTPRGRFSFNKELQNYQDLVEQFNIAGTAINPFRARL